MQPPPELRSLGGGLHLAMKKVQNRRFSLLYCLAFVGCEIIRRSILSPFLLDKARGNRHKN
jgi:hypothetical protein